MAIYTAEYTSPTDLTFPVYAKARQVQRNGVALDWSSAINVSAEVYVDKTAPVTAIGGLFLNATATQNAINSLGFVTTATVYLAYTASDAGSGIATATYSTGGAETTLTGSPMSITLEENVTSATILQITAEDNAGNFSTAHLSFYVDTTAPTATQAPQIVSGNSRNVLINIPSFVETSNFSHNVFALYNFTTDALLKEITAVTSFVEYSTSTDLDYKVYAKAKQVKKSGAAGSYSPSSTSVWIDITAPTLNVQAIQLIDGAGYCKTTPISVTASAIDSHSGMSSLEILVDGATATAMDNGSATSVALGSDSLNKIIRIKAIDNNGNQATYDRQFVLDTTAPTGLVSADITSTFGRTITWNVDLSSATDATSGLAGFEIRSDNSGWGDSAYFYRGQEYTVIQTAAATSTSTMFFALFDKAGNYATAVSSTAISYPPALVETVSGTGEINAAKFTWGAVTINSQGSATDAIAGYEYYATYANASGTFTASSTVVFTSAQEVYVPIPLALLLPSGENKCKIFVRAKDVWGVTSLDWTSSTEVTSRKIEAVDLSNNAFQFVVKKVTEAGSATVSVSTNSSADVDPTLLLLTDGDFQNE